MAIRYKMHTAYTADQVDASNRIWTACGFPSEVTLAEKQLPLSANGENPPTHYGVAGSYQDRDNRRFAEEVILADLLVQGRVSQAELDAAGASLSATALALANDRWNAADWPANGFADADAALASMAGAAHYIGLDDDTALPFNDFLSQNGLQQIVPNI